MRGKARGTQPVLVAGGGSRATKKWVSLPLYLGRGIERATFHISVFLLLVYLLHSFQILVLPCSWILFAERFWLFVCDLTEVRLASFALDTSTSQLRINPPLSHTLTLRLSGCSSVQLSSQTSTNPSSELFASRALLPYPRANLLG